MKENVMFFASVFMGFFAIMNPVGNTPIFIGLVNNFDERIRKKIAFRSVSISFLIIAIFSAAGGIIFKVFGISLPAFQIAGGILVFLVGYQLLHGRESAIHHPSKKEQEKEDTTENIAITPLAIPILAGPGTISTAMNYTGSRASVLHTALVILAFAVISIITYLMFISGEKLVSRVKSGIINVITRLMGLIITVISVQMIISGIRNANLM